MHVKVLRKFYRIHKNLTTVTPNTDWGPSGPQAFLSRIQCVLCHFSVILVLIIVKPSLFNYNN